MIIWKLLDIKTSGQRKVFRGVVLMFGGETESIELVVFHRKGLNTSKTSVIILI